MLVSEQYTDSTMHGATIKFILSCFGKQIMTACFVISFCVEQADIHRTDFREISHQELLQKYIQIL